MGLVQILIPILASLCFDRNCTEEMLKAKAESGIKNETFIVTTLQNGPLSGYLEVNQTFIGTGVAFEVFNILQKEYGFHYVLQPPKVNTFEGEGGAKQMLLDGNADIVVAFLPEKQGDPGISYSRPLDIGEWKVLMKRPKESATGSGLLAPFNKNVWLLIIVSLLGVGPVLWLIMLLRARMCKDEEQMVFSLPSCMWFVYGALLKQGSTLNPRTDSSRILFSTWWIFITILTAFYTANLTAFLTLSKFTLPISEAKDISKRKYQWITNKGNAIAEYLDPKYRQEFGKILLEDIGKPIEVDVLASNETTVLKEHVIKKERMYIREQTVLETIMYKDYQEKTKNDESEPNRCTYVITDFPICQFSRSFAFKANFGYTKLFDFTIQHLRQAGIIQFKHRELLPDAKICPLDLGSKERRLRNSDLAMTYQIVGGGLIISSIIFAIELIVHAFNNHNCCKKRENSNRIFKNNNQFTQNGQESFIGSKNSHFVTPPPPYHSLFGHPPVVPGSTYKKQIINGREYWVVNDRSGVTSLIPQRAPSALLFQFTN